MKQKIINIIDKLQNNYFDFLKFILTIVFWVLILFFVLPLLAKLFISFFKVDTQFNDFILLITAAFIIFYTRETQKMKEEMVKQTKLEQKPIVDFFYRPATPKHKEYLRLRNSGKGVAYNIEVETIKESDRSFEFYFKDPNLILTLNDEQTLLINAKYKNEQGVETWPNDPLNYFLTECVTKRTWENKDENNKKILSEKQKTKLVISYGNAVNQKFKRFFYIYEQIVKADNKKEYEVEFYKEEII